MKIILAVVLTCALIVVGAFLFSRQAVVEVNECMKTYEMNVFSDAARAAIQRQDKETLCGLGQSAVVEMKSCVDGVLEANTIAAVTIKTMSVVKPELDAAHFIEMHNTGCADMPEYVVR